MKHRLFTQLLDRYVEGTATDQETALVENYLDELEKGSVKQRSQVEEHAIQTRMLKRIHSGIKERRGLLVSMSSAWKVGIAAAVMVLAASVWFLVSQQSKSTQQDQKVAVKDVKAPEKARAVITLADGSKVYLDSANSGQLAVQENIKLVKLADGQIAYQNANGEISKDLRYNTLSNPRGSKVIDIRLSDGSHVWLNSGSSITYPVAFVGNDRKVTIEGEAYFEIAHDASKPFIVSKGETSVKVLGTHFNFNAYSDEEDIKVTLLEGSVKVANNKSQVTMIPGQQARVSSEIAVLKDVDLEETMAWKNGKFALNGTDLSVLMRQISRWYNVDIVMKRALPNKRFGGIISREVNLSDVLQALKEYGIDTEFKEDKVIIQ